MPLGILEDRHLEHVPGTSPLNELGHVGLEDPVGIDSNFLKHDPSGKIVLVPQPSDSPNDPYNWPKWKKRMFTVAIAYGCGCVGGKSLEFDLPILEILDSTDLLDLSIPLTRWNSGRSFAHCRAGSPRRAVRHPLATVHTRSSRLLHRCHRRVQSYLQYPRR